MSQPVSSSRLNNSAVNINGASAAISTNYGLAKIGVTGNSFDISSSSGTITLGITGTGNVQIGNSTAGTVSLPGVTTFASLNGGTTTSTINVGSNLIAGGTVVLGSTASTTNLYGILDVARIEGPTAGSAMTIGNNITTGSISIGSTGSNNTVNIGSVTNGPTGTINVGTFAANINVGGVGTTAFIGGTVVIGATGSGNVAIGPNTGSVTNIGNNSAAATTVNLGNTGTSAFGSVNVGRGAATVNIGGNVASAITLGSSTGSVTLGPPLTLGAAPTSSGQLGWTVNGTGVGTTTPGNIASISLTAGSWIIFANLYFPAHTSREMSISATSNTIDNNSQIQVNGSTGTGVSNLSRGVVLTSTTPYYLVAISTPSVTTQNTFFYAVRVGQTLGAAPTAGSSGYAPYLGCVMTGAFVANDSVVPSGTTLTTATLSGVPPGIWILSFNAQVYPNGAVTTTNNLGVKYNISTIINTSGGSLLNVSSEGTNYVNPSAFPIFSGVTCLTITSTTTYYLNVTVTFSGDIRVGTGNSFFRAVRVG